MGELVTETQFLDRYAARYGSMPLSYYHTRTAEIEGQVPSAGEMGFFLDRGDIWGDNPWKQIKYRIPPEARDTMMDTLMDLAADYRFTVSARRNREGKILGARIQIMSDYADERGRPMVEGIVDEPGRVAKINYVRRKVQLPNERINHEHVIHQTRRGDFAQKERG